MIEQRQVERPFQLLLSSYGFNSPIMRGKFAKVIPQDDNLREKTCLVIPYAGFDIEKTFEREKQGLVAFGFDPQRIVFMRDRCDVFTLYFPDYIYVPGGDPFKLLKSIREIGILHDIVEYVKEKRAVYIGVSAGACIASESIEYVTQFEDNNVIDNGLFGSLSLVPENIVCHSDHYSYSAISACKEANGKPVMPIKDNDLIMYKGGKWEYIGNDFE